MTSTKWREAPRSSLNEARQRQVRIANLLQALQCDPENRITDLKVTLSQEGHPWKSAFEVTSSRGNFRVNVYVDVRRLDGAPELFVNRCHIGGLMQKFGMSTLHVRQNYDASETELYAAVLDAEEFTALLNHASSIVDRLLHL